MNNGQNIPENFFSESPVATFIIKPDHELVYWNSACEKLTGIKASQLIGTDKHWTAFYKEKRPCLVDILVTGNFDELKNLYVKYGRSKFAANGINAEGWYEKLGGEKRYIVFDAAPIYNDSGQLVAAIETLHDITETKSAERAKEELIEKLRAQIGTNDSFKGFVPICSSCKNIRVGDRQWITLEEYFDKTLDIRFSHGVCPTCIRDLYPEFYDQDG